MAEARRRYSSQISQEQIPTIDFAGQREVAKGFNSISAAIDRMANQFAEMRTQEAKIEGAEYGILNAPTAEQILDAKKNKKDLKIPGGGTSVYGRAVKKAALLQANDELEMLAKKDILAYLTQAEIDGTDTPEVKSEIENIIAGYAQVFDAESPVLAKQFRAEMGIYGYGKVSTYASDFIIKNNKREKAEFYAGFLLSVDGIKDYIKSAQDIPAFVEDEYGRTIANPNNKTGVDIKAEEHIRELEKNDKQYFMGKATSLMMDSSLIKKIFDQYDAEAKAARVDIITSEVMSRTTGHKAFLGNLEKAAAGKQPYLDNLPPSVKNALMSADPADRRELVDLARQAWHTKIDDIQKDINHDNTTREKRVLDAHREFSKVFADLAMSPGFNVTAEMQTMANNALAVIRRDDPDKYIELRDKWNDVSAGQFDETSPLFAPASKSSTVFGFEQDLVRREQRFSIIDLNVALLNRELTKEDYLKFAKSYEGLLDPRMSEAFELIRVEVGVPKNVFVDKNFLQTQAAKVMNSAKANILRLAAEDPEGSFDPVKWVRDNIGEFIVQQTGDAYAALRQWAKSRTYTNTMSNIAEMRGNNNPDDDQVADELDAKMEQLKKAIQDGFIRIDDVPSWAHEDFIN